MFEAGDKVVCIDIDGDRSGALRLGAIYTIQGVFEPKSALEVLAVGSEPRYILDLHDGGKPFVSRVKRNRFKRLVQ